LAKIIAIFFTLLFITSNLFCDETIIIIRHAEKPENGLGQLSCKGLNRSLKLPGVIIDKFGVPDFLVAPNPSIEKLDKSVSYSYIRPLATIEPLAIKTAKNINLSCGYSDTDCVVNLLLSKENSEKLTLVAWEHHLIDNIVENIAKKKDAKLKIPKWKNDDFDSIYVLKIKKDSVDFRVEKEGLDNQSGDCGY
jgi:hypothetical protein